VEGPSQIGIALDYTTTNDIDDTILTQCISQIANLDTSTEDLVVITANIDADMRGAEGMPEQQMAQAEVFAANTIAKESGIKYFDNEQQES
jgi:hypothetical protein